MLFTFLINNFLIFVKMLYTLKLKPEWGIKYSVITFHPESFYSF